MTAIRKEVVIGDCRLLLGDCLPVMRQLPNVDAVLTDPPYGIGADAAAASSAKQRMVAEAKPKGQRTKTGRGWVYDGESDWDSERPDAKTFEEIRKIAPRQIIWGGNYFTDYLPPSMRWLVWDKGQRDFSLADCEFAWVNENKAARIFSYPRAKALLDGKQHPTQKPVELMEWCLGFLPEGTVLDPFMGSGTTGVACMKAGRPFVGIEISEKYFAIAEKRRETSSRALTCSLRPALLSPSRRRCFDHPLLLPPPQSPIRLQGRVATSSGPRIQSGRLGDIALSAGSSNARFGQDNGSVGVSLQQRARPPPDKERRCSIRRHGPPLRSSRTGGSVDGEARADYRKISGDL